MKILDGGVTSPLGYQATGAAVGIKQGVKDLAMIVSDCPAKCAGAFTTNRVKAASVMRNMEVLAQKGPVRGIVVNSGNANACTGKKGLLDNEEMAKTFGECIKVPPSQILTASTGVIGAMLPMDIVTNGIRKTAPALGSAREDARLAAEAIMTTDTYSKEIAVEIELGGKTARIGGMCKGSGMIHPNMATMLAFVTTDAAISQTLLDKAVKACIGDTYNMISVDGDTSTNDTLLVLANGMAGNPEMIEENEDYQIFAAALYEVNAFLAKNLAKDGEGATKLITVQVAGAATKKDARVLAKAVVGSSLVKAAMFGEDANWGRVICAMGYSGADFDPACVDISFESAKGRILLMDRGTPLVFDEEKAAEILSEKEIVIDIQVFAGAEKAVAWGCDLSYDYVRINGDYRS